MPVPGATDQESVAVNGNDLYIKIFQKFGGSPPEYYFIAVWNINLEKTTMLVETKQMVPITRLQKELTRTLRNVSDSGEAVYIIKGNNMEAVLLSYQEYEYLKELEELFERHEIKNMIETRMENYDPKDTIPWEAVKEEV